MKIGISALFATENILNNMFINWEMVCVHVCAQSCLTLCDPMDYSLSGSSAHGISQAGILEQVAISSSRGSS